MEVLAKRPHGRKRIAHPKVKSGCLTCKTRRIKCDEQKPSCLRCLKAGFDCEYHALNIPKIHHARSALAILLPSSHSIHIRVPLPKQPSQSRFRSEAEASYFEVFSTSTAYEIFPNIEMGRLRSMFLQACESKPSIRHAVIALGALDMTSQALQARYGHEKYGKSATHHYQFAIREYDRAIKHAQTDEIEKDLRTALITSLAILSFEGWIGNHAVATQQIKIGTRLLKEWRERYLNRGSVSTYSTPLSDEENVLSHVFTRLSIQLRSPPPSQPQQSSAALPPLNIVAPGVFSRMPKSFSNLAEAGGFYTAIVRFAVTFVSQALPRIARGGSSLTETYSLAGTVASTSSIPAEIASAQATLTTSLHRWMSAFTSFKTTHVFNTLDEKKAALTLELQMKATYMGTVKSLAQDEMVFDAFHDIYTDIVNLSETLLTISPTSDPTTRAPKFSFDSGVIIPLWFTGHKCRDPPLRRKVISLLLTYPRREGVWDSVFAGLVIDCLRGFEEEFMVDGKVPAWARIRTTNLVMDLERRTVELTCLQCAGEGREDMIMRRRTVDYYVHTGVSLEQVCEAIGSRNR